MSDYSSTYPTQSPVFAFDAKAGKLDSRISYTRSSGGTYLSNEKSLNSENLLLQSQDFDTTWAKDSSLNAPTGSQTAPDGTSTAWLLTTAASGTGTPFLFQNPSGAVSDNTVCTYVVHLKAGTASHAYFSFRGASSSAAWALIDFASPTSPTTGGSLSSISATSVALGSSWYRVALTFNTGTVSSGYPYVYIGASDGTAPDSTGRVTWTYSGETLYAWGAQLSSTNSKVYDSPTTTQISRKYSPLLKTASADAPRFEYASDGQSEGLLIEAQGTNLLNYSEEFDNAYWTKVRTSITPNAAVAPNGELAADLAVADFSSAAAHYVGRLYSFSSGNTYTMSVYVKSAGLTQFTLAAGNNATWAASTRFTLTGSGSAASSSGTAAIQSCGNGWYRCSVTGTAGASASTNILLQLIGGTQNSFIGDDYSGVLLFGASFEQSSSVSSYIKTTSSSVSRASDSCSVVDATLFSSGEHTVIWEGDTDPTSVDKRFFALSDGSSDNRFVADYDNGTATRLRNWADGTNDVSVSSSADNMTVGTHKLAATLKTNEAQLVIDGARRQSDTSCVVGSGIDQLAINSTTAGVGSAYNMNGHCKRLTYYNVALSQAEAEALTSNP